MIEWRAIWTSRVLSAQLAPIQVQDDWTWDQPQDASLQARAKAVLLQAAKARGYENEDQWLDELRYADFVEFEFIGRGTERLPDGMYTKSTSWVLKDAIKHSITLCHQLETGDVPKPIIGRLPREAIAKIEAATAAFITDFEPKVEREVPSLKDKPDRHVCEAKLFREMVVHYFATAARECMSLFASVDEFEAELRVGIARFVHFGVSQYEWLGPMQRELDAGFTLFVKRADPWAGIAEADRESKWHAGVIVGEALSHTSRELIDEAKARLPDTLHDMNGATEPKPDQSTRADSGPVVVASGTAGADRRAVLEPILRDKGYSRSRWAYVAGVDPAVVYDYMKGDSNPNPESRKALAGAIGLPVDDLPK
jgi:hypothetical protein